MRSIGESEMPKFYVTWIEEKTHEINAVDLKEAEAYGRALITRLGSETSKLLSIYQEKPTNRKDDKPPTPFGKPPSGTLGGGQIRVEKLVDAVAA
jgi:hypothetical protein